MHGLGGRRLLGVYDRCQLLHYTRTLLCMITMALFQDYQGQVTGGFMLHRGEVLVDLLIADLMREDAQKWKQSCLSQRLLFCYSNTSLITT